MQLSPLGGDTSVFLISKRKYLEVGTKAIKFGSRQEQLVAWVNEHMSIRPC